MPANSFSVGYYRRFKDCRTWQTQRVCIFSAHFSSR